MTGVHASTNVASVAHHQPSRDRPDEVFVRPAMSVRAAGARRSAPKDTIAVVFQRAGPDPAASSVDFVLLAKSSYRRAGYWPSPAWRLSATLRHVGTSTVGSD